MATASDTTAALAPIAAFDIAPDGRVVPLTGAPDSPLPGDGFAYRWLHLDLTDPAVPAWLESHLPIPVANTLRQTETRPRCDTYDGGLIVNLRGVNLNPGADNADMVSLRLWVAAGTVVSVRIRKIFAIDALHRQMAAGTGPADPGAWLAQVVNGLNTRIEDAVLALEDRADDLEEALLDGEDTDSEEIAPLRARVIKLHRYLSPQREALSRLAAHEATQVSPAVRVELAEESNRAIRLVEVLNSVGDRLKAQQDHMAFQASERFARNGYVLSIVASIFLPLGFLTGLFGVNVGGMPGLDSPWAFAILSAASVLLGLLLFLLFRILRWL